MFVAAAATAQTLDNSPPPVQYTLADIVETSDNIRMTLLPTDKDAAGLTLDITAERASKSGLVKGDLVDVSPVVSEDNGDILGHLLFVNGSFVLYVDSERVPFYSRRVDS